MQQRAPRFERRVTVRTTFYEPDMRRDADNVGFARKFVLDGLVAAGVIKDDSRKYVEQCPDRVLTDRARPRVVVEVSDECPAETRAGHTGRGARPTSTA